MEEKKKIVNVKVIISLAVSLAKSFWDATIHVVWGFSTMFLLAGLLVYFGIESDSASNLLSITRILINNWTLFWWLFFFIETYKNIKEFEEK